MNRIRQVGSLPGIRSVALHHAVRPRIAAVLALRFWRAAWQTQSPGAVLAGEIGGRGSIRTYRLRSSGTPIALQHGRDMEALYELFVRGEYEPPAALAERLAAPARILDIGANIGMFSTWAGGRWPQAQITAFEPMPENTQVYRAWADQAGSGAQLIEAAAGTAAGTADFLTGQGGGDRRATEDERDPAVATEHGEQTVTVKVVDIFEHLPGADFVKMDIEGGEWPILADPRLAQLRNLTWVMEYHRHGAPHLPAVDAARELLEAAGFQTGFGALNHWGHGTLWAWKD